MHISPVQKNNTTFLGKNTNFNTVKWTGYGAVFAGVGSAIAGNKKNIKLHKNLAYLSGILTLAHIAIVEYNSFKYHNQQK